MLKSTTCRPSGKIGPGCHVAWLGTWKSKYRSPVPSEFAIPILPCDVKKKRCEGAFGPGVAEYPRGPEPQHDCQCQSGGHAQRAA